MLPCVETKGVPTGHGAGARLVHASLGPSFTQSSMLCCAALRCAETKGVPMERVQGLFARHWFWGKVMGPAAQEVGPLVGWNLPRNAASEVVWHASAAAASPCGAQECTAVSLLCGKRELACRSLGAVMHGAAPGSDVTVEAAPAGPAVRP